jgi:hypothetical protein
VVQAVADQHDLAREGVEAADLRDIIAVAVLMASHPGNGAAQQHALLGLPAARRLGLSDAKLLAVMLEFDAEVGALREALG